MQIDSLIIHGINVQGEKFSRNDSLWVEANYFIAEEEPAQGGDAPLPVISSPNPIIYLSQYQPAILYLHYLNKAYQVDIPKFERISD